MSVGDMDKMATLEAEIERLRQREEQASELLEWWFNVASNVVGAPKQETIDWLAGLLPSEE